MPSAPPAGRRRPAAMREVPDSRAVPRRDASKPYLSRGLARPIMISRTRRENPSHAFATRPTGACENKSPHKLRCIQNDLLSDHSFDREPEDIHLLGAERMDEG